MLRGRGFQVTIRLGHTTHPSTQHPMAARPGKQSRSHGRVASHTQLPPQAQAGGVGGYGEAGAGRARSGLSQPRRVPARSQEPGLGSWAGQRWHWAVPQQAGQVWHWAGVWSAGDLTPCSSPCPTQCQSPWAVGHSCLETWIEAPEGQDPRPEAEPAGSLGRTQDH